MMSKLKWTLLASFAVAGCAGLNPPPHVVTPTPQARSMQQMLADIDRIRAYVYGAGDQAKAVDAAADLKAWSQRMAELFPPATASQAYVDMSPQRARLAPQAMIAASGALAAALVEGDRGSVGDALARTEVSGCGSCHLSSTR